MNMLLAHKRDFADEIKLRILRWEMILIMQVGGYNLKDPYKRRRQESQSERDWKMLWCWFEDGEGAMNLGTQASEEAGKGKAGKALWSLLRKQACDTFISDFLTSKTVKQ